MEGEEECGRGRSGGKGKDKRPCQKGVNFRLEPGRFGGQRKAAVQIQVVRRFAIIRANLVSQRRRQCTPGHGRGCVC